MTWRGNGGTTDTFTKKNSYFARWTPKMNPTAQAFSAAAFGTKETESSWFTSLKFSSHYPRISGLSLYGDSQWGLLNSPSWSSPRHTFPMLWTAAPTRLRRPVLWTLLPLKPASEPFPLEEYCLSQSSLYPLQSQGHSRRPLETAPLQPSGFSWYTRPSLHRALGSRKAFAFLFQSGMDMSSWKNSRSELFTSIPT